MWLLVLPSCRHAVVPLCLCAVIPLNRCGGRCAVTVVLLCYCTVVPCITWPCCGVLVVWFCQRFRAVPGFNIDDLLREADVLSKLRHPYIIEMKDIFQTDTMLYIVTVRPCVRCDSRVRVIAVTLLPHSPEAFVVDQLCVWCVAVRVALVVEHCFPRYR